MAVPGMVSDGAGRDGGRTRATEERYERRVARFLDYVRARSLGAGWRGLLLAYEALCRDLAPSSRRQYRAALRFWVERHLGLLDAQRFSDQAAVVDKAWRDKQKTGRKSGGGGGLLKQMPEEVRRLLAEYLYAVGTTASVVAGHLILATPVVGLRPMEWSLALLEGDRLKVVNAKYQPGGRGNGPFRTLVLDRKLIKPDEMTAITQLIVYMSGREWNSVRKRVQPHLKAAISALIADGLLTDRWKRLRFYDARHQFSAEAKASLDALKGEVAASMGHASAMTAVHHYGRRRKAQRPCAVRPTSDAVAAVKPATLSRLAGRMVRSAARENDDVTPSVNPAHPKSGDD